MTREAGHKSTDVQLERARRDLAEQATEERPQRLLYRAVRGGTTVLNHRCGHGEIISLTAEQVDEYRTHRALALGDLVPYAPSPAARRCDKCGRWFARVSDFAEHVRVRT